MPTQFTLDATEFDRLQKAMDDYAGNAGPIIDEVLHGEGAELIKQRITALLPASGRTWRGKAPAAMVAMPGKFAQDNAPLSVTVAARGRYAYLYFPDDGSDTKRHVGNQQFMRRGGESAAGEIIDLCIGKLTEGFKEV